MLSSLKQVKGMFSQTNFFCVRWKGRTLRAWGHQLSIWKFAVEMNRKLYDTLKTGHLHQEPDNGAGSRPGQAFSETTGAPEWL